MDSPFSLSGKTILVTGASSGIGKEAAVACAQQGATIIGTGRDKERLAALLAELGGRGHAVVASDLTTHEGREHLLESITSLDGIVHSAGVSDPSPAKFLTEDSLSRILSINLETPLLLTASLLKGNKISNGASIIFIDSIAGSVGFRGHCAYAASKGGLRSAARAMALELAPQDIRVNCIAPGVVKTPMVKRLTKDAPPEVMEAMEASYPLGTGMPEDVSGSIVYFLSPASRWATGSHLIIDGGRTIQ